MAIRNDAGLIFFFFTLPIRARKEDSGDREAWRSCASFLLGMILSGRS